MGKLKVEIVTPVHNRCELTLQCLRSLARSDKTNLEMHTIIVDDGSTDGTAEAVREHFPKVEVVRSEDDLWYTAGTNLGIETALKHNPDYVLCINNDSIFDENCVRRMVECAEKYPRSVIGGLLLLWDEPHRVFQVAPKWETWGGGWRHWSEQTVWTIPQKPWAVELIVGNCVLYPAKVFAEVGLMDAKHSTQFGDAEFTTRIRKKGWRLLIEPRARVFCQPNYEPQRVFGQPWRKKLDLLFFNKTDQHNLRLQFRQLVKTAPTKAQGAAAFGVFYWLWLWRKLARSLGREVKPESKLAEVYSETTLEN